MADQSHIQVEFTPLFERFVKQLAKKFPNVLSDLKPLVDQLENGETPGDRVRGTGHLTYKARVKNTDVSKGKSGGYRTFYYLREGEKIVLIAIYSKTEKVDISTKEIRKIIKDYEQYLKP